MEIIRNAVLMLCLIVGTAGFISFVIVGGIALKVTIIDEDFTRKIILVFLTITVASGAIALMTYLMLK